jgi:hypothetical protein
MAYQQSDLDRLDTAILAGVKKVAFADGRSTEFHSLDEMRRLRTDVKAELAASASQTSRRTRLTIARVGRYR